MLSFGIPFLALGFQGFILELVHPVTGWQNEQMVEVTGVERCSKLSQGAENQITYVCAQCGCTQIDSQSSDVFCPRSSNVVKSWAKLPEPLMAAIEVIDSSNSSSVRSIMSGLIN